MSVNRIAALLISRHASRDNPGEAVDGETYERIGRAVCRFLNARRQGRHVDMEDFIRGFRAENQELARRCFETAEMLLLLEEF